MIPKLLRKLSSQEAYITQQYIFNHDKKYANQFQTPSFLKQSLNATPQSKIQFEQKETPELVQELGILSDRIYGISVNRAHTLKRQIQNRSVKKQKNIKVKTIKLKDLIVEQKQNKCIFQQKPQLSEQNKDDYANFEMDQNLNYVQNIPNFQQNDQHISTIGLQSKDHWLTSEEYNSKQNSTVRLKSDFFSISANSTRKKLDFKFSKVSVQSEKPKGVYQQILSLYSTAKLLALKRQFN